jgi:hypothetical protein
MSSQTSDSPLAPVHPQIECSDQAQLPESQRQFAEVLGEQFAKLWILQHAVPTRDTPQDTEPAV